MNLIEQVKAMTGITTEALARKLRASTGEIETWEIDDSGLPAEATKALADILKLTKKPAAEVPRIAAPTLDSKIVCANSLDYLKKIPDSTVSMILSDIPYGIGQDDWDILHKNTNSAYMGSSAAQQKAGAVFKKRRKPINGWSSADREIPKEYHSWCLSWSGEWLRVLKPGGAAVVFAGRRLVHRCIVALEDSGFNFRDLLAWEKTKAVMRAQRLSVVFKRRGALAEAKRFEGWRVGNLKPLFEPIIWCFKPYDVTIADNMLDHGVGAMNLGAYELQTGGTDNILRFGFHEGERGFHEAQKPVALMRALIELCTDKGQVVLDPFAGSGSTAVAAKISGRKHIAVEQDPDLIEIVKKRVSDVQTEFLF